MSVPSLDDGEVLASEVYVQLVCEVWREKNRYTELIGEAWVPCNPIIFFPFYLLPVVLLISLLG